MKEKETIKEAKLVEEKRTNKTVLTAVIILFLVVIGGAFIIALNNVGLLKVSFLKPQKAELNYTQTTTKFKEGVYITDVSETVEEVMPSIVAITSKSLVKNGWFGPFYRNNEEEQYQKGAGSGIIISKNDQELLILTNNHVVEGADELSVQFINEKSVDATVKGTSEKKDVAVISIKLSDLDSDTINAIKIATLGDSNTLKVGNGVIAIGNALGYGQSVTVGVVSALDRPLQGDTNKQKSIQMDAAINGGNSGGALLNAKGEVVGINYAKYSANSTSSQPSIEGMCFAIPISNVKDTITALMNGEEDTSDAKLGIEGYMIDETQGKNYNMPQGFYISKIEANSGADKAKLEIGNIITKADGKEVKEFSDLSDLVSEKKKGDKIKLTISYISGRSYKEKEVEVTLS
ncbi:MAG: trypsin-like peptidase domain-containing protein [Bacilli bacterium]|nr:trypsin-like peptidase domain-containing protein [Bacilli bacterium]